MEKMYFNITGEYITNIARSWLYEERRPYQEVETLLLECMCGTDMSKEILQGYAFDILNLTRKFIGNTADDTFSLVQEELKDTRALRKKYPLYKYINDLMASNKTPFEICQYGFIDTKGKYIPVDWCEHSEFANDYVKENIPMEEVMKSDFSTDMTDYLVYELGWVLIENPQQGTGIVHYKKLNKKQRETLYDYYIHYGRTTDAKLLYDEESGVF